MAKRERPGEGRADPPAPFHNPFAGLADRLGIAPAPPPPGPEAAPSAPAAPARAVVRLERKGRGGKEVTVVERLALAPAELERLLRELKQALGCGGAVADGALLLQGDLRDRVRTLLEARGVRKVSVG